MAYNIIFYENKYGKSEIWDFLENLRLKSKFIKDARIQYNQALLYIQLLQDNGTWLPSTITKYLGDGLWELRPGNNRILYFYNDDDSFILLHCFRKKSQKTPHKELLKAKSMRDDYISRKDYN